MRMLPASRHGLRAAILLPLAAALAIFVAVNLCLSISQEEKFTEEYIDDVFLSASRDFDTAVHFGTDKLSATLTVIASDEALKRAMAADDRQALLRRAQPVFESLRKEYGITHFYLMRPDRSVFLRLHKPELHGDVIERYTARQAEATGNIAAGLELGPLGTFTLRSVIPWRDGDRLIGYIELGKEIGVILDSIRENLALDVIVTINKRYLSQRDWKQVTAITNNQWQWDSLPESVVVFQTLPVASPAIRRILLREEQPDHAHEELTDHDRKFRTGHVLLKDAAGREVGNMLLLRDVTARSAQAARDRILSGGLVSGLGGALLCLFYLIIVRVEERLTSSQAEIQRIALKYELLFENSRDALMTLAPPSWRFTGANHATLQLFGASGVEEFTALEPWEVSPELQPDGRTSSEKAQEMIATAMETGTCFFEWKHQKINGEQFDADVLLTRMEAGGEVYLQATVRDITGRKRSEEELRLNHDELTMQNDELLRAQVELSAAQERYADLYEMAPVGYCTVACETGMILRANLTAATMLGIEREGLINQKISGFILPEDQDIYYLFNRRLGERQSCELRMVRNDGMKFWTSLISTAAQEKDGVRAVRIVLSDITERKLAEFELRNAYQELENTQNASLNIMVDLDREADERRRAEAEVRKLNDELEQKVMARTAALEQARLDLEQASRGKDEFLAAISHELKTPLNHILGFSDLLKEGLVGELSAEQREMAQHIFDAGNRQLSIVNSLIELARLQAGKARIYARMEEPARLLNEIATLHVARALKAGLDFTIELEQGRGEMPLDREVVEHLLEQLLSNAFKFTQSGGKVRLTSRHVPRADVAAPVLVEADEYLELCVADNGPGIAPEILPRLFQPFVQGDGRLNRNYQGTGIGLVLVRLLAELHGGGSGVESRPGIGTKFMVWLPCKANDNCQIPEA